MAVGFAIPNYVLILCTYGWWVYNFIVFEHEFKHVDLLMTLWLLCIIVLHLMSNRVIYTRVGYDEHTFYPKNPVWLVFSWIFGLPIIFCDWPWARGFCYFLARTWHNYWIVLIFIKAGMLATVYLILPFFIDEGDVLKPIGQTYFAISFTMLMVVAHVWVYKIFLLCFYIVPWILYTIIWMLLFPFEKCFSCVRTCRAKYKSKKEDVSHSYSYSYSESYEGGDIDEEEEDPVDDENFENTDRELQVRDVTNEPRKNKKSKSKSKSKSKDKKKKAYKEDKLRLPTQTDHLETNEPVDDLEGAKHSEDGQINIEEGEESRKKRRRRRRKHVSRKVAASRMKKPEAERKKRDHRDPDDLYYFQRVWRDMGNKWCEYCDEDIHNHQDFMKCEVGHYLHIKCAYVKWVGRRVCPLCVEQPKERPPELDPNYGKSIVIPEEIQVDIENEVPMKPNIE